MNPTLRASRLDDERRKDPSRYAREYEAAFIDGLAAFLSAERITSAVVTGRAELPPLPGVGPYYAAVDISGGMGGDTFSLAIVHLEDGRIVQDVVRGWTGSAAHPLELQAVVREIAELCRRFGVRGVVGDRYAAEWSRQAFRDARLAYWPSPWSKSDAYHALEQMLVAGQLELLDQAPQLRELRGLERRHLPGGRIVIDHPPGGHDDHANALALAAALALPRTTRTTTRGGRRSLRQSDAAGARFDSPNPGGPGTDQGHRGWRRAVSGLTVARAGAAVVRLAAWPYPDQAHAEQAAECRRLLQTE